MDKNGNHIVMGLDVSTKTIGVCVLLNDSTNYKKIIELTHISPKIKEKVENIEELCLKKRIFQDFIQQFKESSVDEVIIEEPLLSSNNSLTVATLLRFNGMISDCIYSEFGIVPKYISSYNARKYSFPELMAIRKYNKKGETYDKNKIIKSIKESHLVLFGDYPWAIDKKTVIQQYVADIFPNIEWLYDKKGELKKENFDSCDAYVACLGYINMQEHGEDTDKDFKITDIEIGDNKITYNVNYWNTSKQKITYI